MIIKNSSIINLIFNFYAMSIIKWLIYIITFRFRISMNFANISFVIRFFYCFENDFYILQIHYDQIS